MYLAIQLRIMTQADGKNLDKRGCQKALFIVNMLHNNYPLREILYIDRF